MENGEDGKGKYIKCIGRNNETFNVGLVHMKISYNGKCCLIVNFKDVVQVFAFYVLFISLKKY